MASLFSRARKDPVAPPAPRRLSSGLIAAAARKSSIGSFRKKSLKSSAATDPHAHPPAFLSLPPALADCARKVVALQCEEETASVVSSLRFLESITAPLGSSLRVRRPLLLALLCFRCYCCCLVPIAAHSCACAWSVRPGTLRALVQPHVQVGAGPPGRGRPHHQDHPAGPEQPLPVRHGPRPDREGRPAHLALAPALLGGAAGARRAARPPARPTACSFPSLPTSDNL
jgi:hypothetical protein